MTTDDRFVNVFTTEPVDSSGRPLMTRSLDSTTATAVAVPLTELKRNMDSFVQAIEEMLASASDAARAFQTSEVVVQAQVGTDGKVGFLGSGIGASAQASLTIKFARRPAAPTEKKKD